MTKLMEIFLNIAKWHYSISDRHLSVSIIGVIYVYQCLSLCIIDRTVTCIIIFVNKLAQFDLFKNHPKFNYIKMIKTMLK